MPKKIQDFAQQSLVKPVLVNVGRAGAANLDVLQVVEYVKQEAKMVYLLECLQKTPPPVIIFSDNKNEVDGMCVSVVAMPLLTIVTKISKNTYYLRALRRSLFMVQRVCIHSNHTGFVTYSIVDSPGRTSICNQIFQIGC